jgi:hypothetical protein
MIERWKVRYPMESVTQNSFVIEEIRHEYVRYKCPVTEDSPREI